MILFNSLLLLLGKLVGIGRLLPSGQPVINATLPSRCASPDVNVYLKDIAREGWRAAMSGGEWSEIIDISKELDEKTVVFGR